MNQAEFEHRHKFFEWWQTRRDVSVSVSEAETAMGRPPFTYTVRNYLLYVYNPNHPRSGQIGQMTWHDWRDSGDFGVVFPDGQEVVFSEYDQRTGGIKWPEWLKWIDKSVMTEQDWSFLEGFVPGVSKFKSPDRKTK